MYEFVKIECEIYQPIYDIVVAIDKKFQHYVCEVMRHYVCKNYMALCVRDYIALCVRGNTALGVRISKSTMCADL